MRRSEENVWQTEVSDNGTPPNELYRPYGYDLADGSWPSTSDDGTPPNELYRPYGYDPADGSASSEASPTSHRNNSPRYAPTEGTDTESYDLSNITRSPNSARDPMTGSDDSSAAGSPGRQSTDNDGTDTPPMDEVHGVAAVDSYYGYHSPTRMLEHDRAC